MRCAKEAVKVFKSKVMHRALVGRVAIDHQGYKASLPYAMKKPKPETDAS